MRLLPEWHRGSAGFGTGSVDLTFSGKRFDSTIYYAKHIPYTIFDHTILHILHYTTLHHTTLHYTTLHYPILHSTILGCTSGFTLVYIFKFVSCCPGPGCSAGAAALRQRGGVPAAGSAGGAGGARDSREPGAAGPLRQLVWRGSSMGGDLVGGLEHQFYFPIQWESHHPN